jgi:hypothetical protein
MSVMSVKSHVQTQNDTYTKTKKLLRILAVKNK